jgi:tripeptide aminopeptidase
MNPPDRNKPFGRSICDEIVEARSLAVSWQSHVTDQTKSTSAVPPTDLHHVPPDGEGNALSSESLDRLMRCLAIPGVSRRESKIAEWIREDLIDAGAPPESIMMDNSHKAFGGECGNIIVNIPGTMEGPRRALVAHMDTVPLCAGCEPLLDGRYIRSGDSKTGLGADNRAGVSVLLETHRRLRRTGSHHPPLTLLFTVAEEIGMLGVRHLHLDDLHRPEVAFNFDGGRANKITIGATGKDNIQIRVSGTASHAGVTPRDGISALTIAARAINRLHESGILGDCQVFGTPAAANLGVITGGTATNVVPECVVIDGEIRSSSLAVRDAMHAAMESAFATAAGQVAGRTQGTAKCDITRTLAYEAFRLSQESESVRRASDAILLIGQTPIIATTAGGIDANWLVRRGLQTASLGCGCERFHTLHERLNLDEFMSACRIAFTLATAG